jgi:hypothetical protein
MLSTAEYKVDEENALTAEYRGDEEETQLESNCSD